MLKERSFQGIFLFSLILLAACAAPATPLPLPTAVLDVATMVPTALPTALLSASATPAPAYPAAGENVSSMAENTAYPAPSQVPDPTATAVAAESDSAENIYLPITGASPPTPAPGPTEPPPPTAMPSPVPTVDFPAVQAELAANGQELGFVKIGFHVTLLEPDETAVLDNWLARLDEAGVPVFLKTVDNAEPLYKAQELRRESGVPHVLVYRSTGAVPHYELPAAQAAQIHWAYHRDLFPPELDPSQVWIETLNEPDRTKAEWLGQFALETARLAMADGYRWAAFGFAAGEPEPEQWQTPAMQAFLQLAAENPDRLAVALHEYSYLKEDIGHEYPYKIGRFQELFAIADGMGIARPTVLVTEWGWEHDNIPSAGEAMDDIKWASRLYAAYPEVQGASIWNLGVGCCFGDISDQVQEIIDPLTEYSLTKYYALPSEQSAVDPNRFQP